MADPTDKQPAGKPGDPYADAPRTVGGRTARLARPEGLDDAMRAGLKMNAPRTDKNVTGTLKGHPAPKEVAVACLESPADEPSEDPSSSAELDDDPGIVRDEPINFADIFVDRPPSEGSSDAASGPVPKREPVELPREKVAIKGADQKGTAHRASEEVEDVLVQLPSGGSPTDVTMLSVSVRDQRPSSPSRSVWVAVLGGAALAGLLVWWALRAGPAPVGDQVKATPPENPPATAPAAEASERGDSSAEAPREDPPEAEGAEPSDASSAPAPSAAPAAPAKALPKSPPPSIASPLPPSPSPPSTTEPPTPEPAASGRIF